MDINDAQLEQLKDLEQRIARVMRTTVALVNTDFLGPEAALLASRNADVLIALCEAFHQVTTAFVDWAGPPAVDDLRFPMSPAPLVDNEGFTF